MRMLSLWQYTTHTRRTKSKGQLCVSFFLLSHPFFFLFFLSLLGLPLLASSRKYDSGLLWVTKATTGAGDYRAKERNKMREDKINKTCPLGDFGQRWQPNLRDRLSKDFFSFLRLIKNLPINLLPAQGRDSCKRVRRLCARVGELGNNIMGC